MRIKNKKLRYHIDGRTRRKADPSGNADNQQPVSRRETELGLHQEALRLLESGIGFADNNPELHFISGRACEALNMAGRAIQEYSLTLKLNPEHIGAYNNLALAYSQQENYRKAIRILNEGIARGRPNPVFIITWGMFILHWGMMTGHCSPTTRLLKLIRRFRDK